MKGRVSIFIFLLISMNIICKNENGKTKIEMSYINDNTRSISLHINLKQNDFILKNSIDISVDHPDVTLSHKKTEGRIIERYEPTFKDTKKLFTENVTIHLNVISKKPFSEIGNAYLYISYYLGSKKQTVQELFPLLEKTVIGKKTEPVFLGPEDVKEEVVPRISKYQEEKTQSFSDRISNTVANTNSFWIRIFLVLILGLLMSLTPCIYPMIPITVGILQTQGSKSVAYNFLQSLCYTSGIATTFALLGITAAFTGQLFGSLMGNPFIIVFLASFLVYLGLSMFGFYEMYTPKFLNKNRDVNKVKKSLLSIFIFGAISGTVASPCLSPGLILLLSIVTTIGSKLIGFALLFSFGIGLGIPLLLIGTFSSSLDALPRAGTWMLEIKKLFGFMLFGMAFYFLKNILPLPILFLIMTIFMFAAGLFYFYSVTKSDSRLTKTIKNIIAVLCIVFSVLLALKTYQAHAFSKLKIEDNFWYTDHQKALDIAKKEKKHLFIDIGAQFCSICKAIDGGLLANKKVRATMNKFVNLKIESSICPEEIFEGICSKYGVVGYPTYLLIDSQNGNLLANWGGELYDISEEKFIEELKKY